ncbi:MAG: PKD domain-containing protein [Saprospiraceae bacterium]|nr:PKD domain-containing protein [Saprospiraceae bacterium]
MGFALLKGYSQAVVADNLSYFTQDKSQVCNGVAIQFTSTKTVTPDAQSWDFGDGNTSVEADPRHTYTTPGLLFCETCNYLQGCQSQVISSACIQCVHSTYSGLCIG